MASLPTKVAIPNLDPNNPPPPRVIGTLPPQRVSGVPRPSGVHTKHLTELERFRVRTLYYDALLSKTRIKAITGYTDSQIRTAIRAKSATVIRRPGRPKKGSKAPGAASPTQPGPADAEAELLKQAREFFAQGPGSASADGGQRQSRNHGRGDGEDSSQEDGEEEGRYNQGDRQDHDDNDDDDDDDEDDDAQIRAQLSALVESPKSTTPASRSTSVVAVAAAAAPSHQPAPPPPRPKGFLDLPQEVRIHIWRCYLSVAPTQVAHQRTWAMAVLSRAPWLELSPVPPPQGVKFENPPWAAYVRSRHVPALVLAQVCREARWTVLNRLTPIRVSDAIRQPSGNTPPFIWVDRYSDVIHFSGERQFTPDLFDKAGQSICPHLYRWP